MQLVSAEAEKLQRHKGDWVRDNVNFCGDLRIIEFIGGILFHGAAGISAVDSIETVRSLFENGYCYYFAKMLEEAFPGGTICVCYPYGHVVYVLDGVAYDIVGVSSAEYEMYIPISEFGPYKTDFMHVPNIDAVITEQQLVSIGENARRLQTYVIAMSDLPACHEVAANCRNLMNGNLPELKSAFDAMNHSLIYDEIYSNLGSNNKIRIISDWCTSNGLDYNLIKRIQNGFSQCIADPVYQNQKEPQPIRFC